MPLTLTLVLAILAVGAFFAALLHPRVFPLDEQRRELRLDEHLTELAHREECC